MKLSGSCVLIPLVLCVCWAKQAQSDVPEPVVEVLQVTCFACHADGEAEGGFAIDELLELPVGPGTREQWHRVLKNVRSQIMPPSDAEQPTVAERRILSDWIAEHPLGLDVHNPDPGRVTLRRLNRVEYRNTVRDLMGVEYETEVEFPPDDSGHGFDNLSDALSLSPLLMEKYLAAAEQIVARAVPMQPWVYPSVEIGLRESASLRWEGSSEEDRESSYNGKMSFFENQTLVVPLQVEVSGDYRLVSDMTIDHGFAYSPGRAKLTIAVDGKQLQESDHDWGDEGDAFWDLRVSLDPGMHELTLVVQPLVSKSLAESNGDDVRIHFETEQVRLIGPMTDAARVRPPNWERFFSWEESSTHSSVEQAAHIIHRFATKAFRRPPKEDFVKRLVQWIGPDLQKPDVTFEKTLAKAFVAILSSPRFVFREEPAAQLREVDEESTETPGLAVPIDEYSLANRLSYFLWSTMPDEQLFQLAQQGELRNQLPEQIDRMLADERSQALSSNFVGQWLKTRDLESMPIDVLAASGLRPEYDALRFRLREVFDERRKIARDPEREPEEADRESRSYREYEVRLLLNRLRELRSSRDQLDARTRKDLKRQTERLFEYVLHEDRNVLELIDNDYGFLNERLVSYYGLDSSSLSESVDDELKRVQFKGKRRGGVLRQGNFLIVTSNPTRTSPVKRGLFILDNILGTPAPPAPAAVPELEEAADEDSDEEPSLRALLEKHRSEPLCASCHRRFDPLGLALENYDALGRWRDQEGGNEIDPSGELISGESFENADGLMRALTSSRRHDFYRCLTEKMLTYAIGRGIEYHDDPMIDQLVRSLEEDGRTPTLRRLIHGIVGSPAFQKMRLSEVR